MIRVEKEYPVVTWKFGSFCLVDTFSRAGTQTRYARSLKYLHAVPRSDPVFLLLNSTSTTSYEAALYISQTTYRGRTRLRNNYKDM